MALAAAACVDLFHSTDFDEVDAGDASTEAAPADVTPIDAAVDVIDAARLDFCAWSRSEARAHAIETCARLSACELPVGRNAAGTCIADAILAFDCSVAPSRPVRNAPDSVAHATWQCLVEAKTCADVDRCLFGASPPDCLSQPARDGGVTFCQGSTRVDCLPNEATPHGEPCAAHGQTCEEPQAFDAHCGIPGFQTETCGAATASCSVDGGLLADCDPTGNFGTDCRSYGAGHCSFVRTSLQGGDYGCQPVIDAGGCDASSPVACEADGGRVVGCPLGATERVDCTAFAPDVLCNLAAPVPGASSDLARYCSATTPECTHDTCNLFDLVACVRGKNVPVPCAAAGLGGCKPDVPTADGPRASCGRP